MFILSGQDCRAGEDSASLCPASSCSMRKSTFSRISFCVAFSLRGVPLLLLLRLLLVDNIVFLLGVSFGSGLSFTKRSGQTRTNGHQGRTRAAEVGGWRVGAASAKHVR